ncbi:inovirus-type Gp2 protein [Aeromonas caviae]
MFNSTKLTHIIELVENMSIDTVPKVAVINSRREGVYLTSKTKGLLDALEAVGDYFCSHTYISSAHPTVVLFLSHMQHVDGLARINQRGLNENTANELAKDINDVLNLLHQELYGKQHQKKLNNLLRVAPRNSQSIDKYIPVLFIKYAKLLFVRLDIGYREDIYSRLSADDAIDDRRRYLALIKKRFPHMVGYIWKMEYGKDRRFHSHLTLIFNGAYHQQDGSLGRLLGKYWEDCTYGLGTYYNCANRRRQYQEWDADGIGMVHWDDEKKQEKLFKALEYLTKPDELMLATLPSPRRTFGRMEIPEASRRRGRPRINRSGLPVLI